MCFRKGLSIEHCLLRLLEKWKNAAEKGKAFGASTTNPCKALNCLKYEFLIAKLDAYGFTIPALRLIYIIYKT